MSTPTGNRSATVRARVIYGVIAVALTALLLTLEVMLFRSYTASERTTRDFSRTTTATTSLANVQRETMLVTRMVTGMRARGDIDTVELRWGLLERQLDILERQVADEPSLARSIKQIDVAQRRVGARLRTARHEPLPVARGRLAEPLTQLEAHVKALFDDEEHALFGTLADTLRGREDSQLLIASLGMFALVLAGILAVFVRRSVRRRFHRAYAALAAEVEERKGLQEQLWHQSRHDPLTGLANRLKFQDDLKAMAERRSPAGENVGVIYLDLDGFKGINDAFGHDAGDELLRQAATRFRACVREHDELARLGGDEFAILLPGVKNDDAAREIAERLRRQLDAPFSIHGRSVTVGASIGIAVAAAPLSAEELVSNADMAMYAVKNDGKGAVQAFRSVMRRNADARRELEEELRETIEAGTLELHYQPIVALGDRAIDGVEALVRWPHPTRGLLLPSEFLPVAAECELMAPLGRWVLQTACEQAARWHREGHATEPWISVNLDPQQLRDPALLDHVEDALERSGLRRSQLVLEISERAMLDSSHRAVGTLQKLSAEGVRLALDDFGVGFSSLSYMRFLPIAMLKLDRVFTENIGRDPGNRRIAQAVLELGRSAGLQTIAEGIERPEELAQLAALGCSLGQGYLFSRPAPAEAIGTLLAAGDEAPLAAVRADTAAPALVSA
jgi:diguanylate cyclase (GGDEF)-like protein